MLSDFINSFVDIIGVVAPIDVAWILGVLGYRFIVDALTGRNASLK